MTLLGNICRRTYIRHFSLGRRIRERCILERMESTVGNAILISDVEVELIIAEA